VSTILNSPVEECRRHRGLTVLTLDSPAGFQRSRPGGGLFSGAHLESLLELTAFLGRRDQTLTWFGFTPEELHPFVLSLHGRAIDRNVPIGQALQFHRFWEGYDLLHKSCRCVCIESTFLDDRPTHPDAAGQS